MVIVVKKSWMNAQLAKYHTSDWLTYHRSGKHGTNVKCWLFCSYVKHIDKHILKMNGSAANKYFFSAGHHEQKNKKTTGQIKFLAVTIKQIKPVFRYSPLCKYLLMYWFKWCHNFIYSISCLVKKFMNYGRACKFFYKKLL